MSFGYVPNPELSPIKRLVLSAVGYTVVTRRIEAPLLLKLLSLSQTDKVLDAGCGDGIMTTEFGKRCRKIVGVDLSEGNLAAAKKNAVRAGLTNATFVEGDIRTLPFADNSFDKVYSNSVLQYVKKEETVLSEFFRVLRPGGTVVLTAPSARKNVGESGFRLVPLLLRLPKPMRKIICTKPLNDSKNVEDFQTRQLCGNWKAVKKGYVREELAGKFERQGFEDVVSEYYLKAFGGLAQDFRCAVRGCNGFFSFLFLYPLSLLDKLAPGRAEGYFFVVRAQKPQQ